ncbi:ABC transporter substrate-binding protein [Angelakisella massiliensis]|uniref:ABC transporter substrate-binding protein n=1 Tax=Angelakisella massiliensis TaxID=1871018 RepID=UPI0008F89C64|nr:ABC transporter substrate-binding protein [Angelakisella massiliensis]
MKKVLAIVLAAALALTTLAGCSGGSTGTAPASSSSTALTGEDGGAPTADQFEVTEPIEIEWWHAQESQYAETIDKVIADFEAQNPNIKVNAIYQGSYTELNEKLIAAQAAGNTLPALVVANTPYVAEYGASGLCEVLDPYIEATGFEIDDFGEGLVASTQYDGQQVALPFLISTQIMFYNKTMADEEGIKLPETWDEMDAFMEAASKDGRYATVFPGWDQWYFEPYYLNRGVKLVNDDQVSTDLDSDLAIETAQKLKEWCDKGYAYWAYGTDASSIMRQNFIDGKTFSVMHTTSLYNTYVDNCDFEVGMHYYPGDVTRDSEVGGCVLLIPAKNSQEVKNAGWKLLSYLCSKEVNMIWASESGYMPTRNSVLQTEEGEAFLAEKPAFKAVFDNLDNINPRIQHPAWSSFANIWKETMAKSILENGDIAADMKNAVTEMNEVLSDA